MRFLKTIFFIAISLVIVALVLDLVLPSRGHAESSLWIGAPDSVILSRLLDPKMVEQWNVFSRPDSAWSYRYFGPARGKGAGYWWSPVKPDGYHNYKGEWIVTGTRGQREVDGLLKFHGWNMQTAFEIGPKGQDGGIWVKWIIDMQAGPWPWQRFYALGLASVLDPAMASGLDSLKKQCESSIR